MWRVPDVPHEPLIVLTDADAEVPESSGPSRPGRCPQCGAKPDRRIEGSGFGPVELRPQICGACGYEFPRE